MDMNENDKHLLASDLERRLIRIETRLTRFMRHFNLDNEGAPMPANTSAHSPLVNDDENSSVQHRQGQHWTRIPFTTKTKIFADKLRKLPSVGAAEQTPEDKPN